MLKTERMTELHCLNLDNNEMHRLIGAQLSSKLNEQEKLDMIENEYNIPISKKFREDVSIMCNLSTGIEERVCKSDIRLK